MPFTFTPDENADQNLKAPYFEDARADVAPGYAATKSEKQIRNEILSAMTRLGGVGTQIRQGTFGVGNAKRYGYEIAFHFMGHPSLIQVAALPMRSETPEKKARALKQALWVVSQWLKAAVTTLVFSPGYEPLVQFMLVPGKDRTVGEMLLIENQILNLNPSLPSGDVVDGKYEDT